MKNVRFSRKWEKINKVWFEPTRRIHQIGYRQSTIIIKGLPFTQCEQHEIFISYSFLHLDENYRWWICRQFVGWIHHTKIRKCETHDTSNESKTVWAFLSLRKKCLIVCVVVLFRCNGWRSNTIWERCWRKTKMTRQNEYGKFVHTIKFWVKTFKTFKTFDFEGKLWILH